MEVTFAQWLKKENLLGKSDKILVAVSGGADSMALLRLLHLNNLDIGVAHCNFQLRGEESDQDESFVRETCASLGIPIHVERFDTRTIAIEEKRSIQETARFLRYDWFRSLLEEYHYTKLCTAHHATDNVETVFINLVRGTGIAGLAGIRHHADLQIVRPLLDFKASQIRAWMDEHSYTYRNDSSNTSDKYTRNYIRHHILPVFYELEPDLEQAIARTTRYVNEQTQLYEFAVDGLFKQASKKHDGGYSIDLSKLEHLPQPHLVLERGLAAFGFTRSDCKQMITMQSGGSIHSSDYVVSKDRTTLRLAPRSTTPNLVDTLTIHRPGTYVFGNYTIEVTPCKLEQIPQRFSAWTLFLIGSVEACGLKLRQWTEGDRIQPFGMKGSKLLSDVFIDSKVPVGTKSAVPIILSNETIVWVPPYVKSELTRLNPHDLGADVIATQIHVDLTPSTGA